jgi:cystathionine beta-lyase/cystathionine gamma-synthase
MLRGANRMSHAASLTETRAPLYKLRSIIDWALPTGLLRLVSITRGEKDMTQSQDRAHWRFDTVAVHGGYSPEPTTKSVAVPLYQTVAYAFDSAQHGADLFDLKVPGNIYTRIMNPTQDVLEQRLAALEGGIAALALASGQAATTYAIQTIAEVGDNIVSSSTICSPTPCLNTGSRRASPITAGPNPSNRSSTTRPRRYSSNRWVIRSAMSPTSRASRTLLTATAFR